MSFYHDGHDDGWAVECGDKPGYNEELLTNASYRNGMHDGRKKAIDLNHLIREHLDSAHAVMDAHGGGWHLDAGLAQILTDLAHAAYKLHR